MKNIYKLLIVAFLAITFVSCQDEDNDDKDPADTSNYYPLTQGTSWEYSVNEVSSDGTSTLLSYEKNEVDGTESLDGKTVTVVKVYQREDKIQTWGDPHENLNGKYYTENDKVYTSVSYIENLLTFEEFNLSFPLMTDLKFVKMIDFSVDSWNVIEMPYNDFPLAYEGQNLTFNGTITLKAKNLASKDYSNTKLALNGSAKVVEYSFELKGDVSMSLTGTKIPMGTISVASKREHWFLNNVGLVKRVDSAVSLSATGTLSQFLEGIPDIPGNTYELEAFNDASVTK